MTHTHLNTAACCFEALMASLRLHPEHPQAEVHALNLSLILSAMPGHRACVALVHARNCSSYQHLQCAEALLAQYQVVLEQRWHESKPAFFLFARLEDDEGPAGAAVKVPEPDPELELGIAA